MYNHPIWKKSNIRTIVRTTDWLLQQLQEQKFKMFFFATVLPYVHTYVNKIARMNIWNLVLVIVQNMIPIQLQFPLRDSNMGYLWRATSLYSTTGASQIVTPVSVDQEMCGFEISKFVSHVTKFLIVDFLKAGNVNASVVYHIPYLLE